MTDAERPGPESARVRAMTVAALRERAGADHVGVVFLESARIFRLERRHPEFERLLGLLRVAQTRGVPVGVELATAHGDAIRAVRMRGTDPPRTQR